ncbi:M15 family metallopeptidase [bacterium SCSIO 12741]|nr:M15 family metallopeptidase [bacterium SCSIO 12741]
MRNLSPILFTVLILASCSTPPAENKTETVPQETVEKQKKSYGLHTANWEEYQQQVSDKPNHQLVDLYQAHGDLKFDIRYATDSNFAGKTYYPFPGAFARKPVSDALKKVSSHLKDLGYGLLIYDAYRPYSVTVAFYETYPDTTYVASPYFGSRHNRGAAVDLTLFDLSTGKAIDMGTPYDDFTEKAHPDYLDLPEEVLKNRQVLMDAMDLGGFDVYPSEWWHYDFRGWKEFPLLNVSFEELRENEKN